MRDHVASTGTMNMGHPGFSMHNLDAFAACPACRVVVVGRSTCPFCIEVSRTLADMGLSFPYFLGTSYKPCLGLGTRLLLTCSPARAPAVHVPSVRPSLAAVDKMLSGAALHEELKKATGQRTVPYVWVAGKLLGGCDDTKALIASGEFDKVLGGAGDGSGGTNSSGGKPLDYGELQVGWNCCCCRGQPPLGGRNGGRCTPVAAFAAFGCSVPPQSHVVCCAAGRRGSPGRLCRRLLHVCRGSCQTCYAPLRAGPSSEEDSQRLLGRSPRGAVVHGAPEGRSSSLPAGGAQLISARRRGAAHLCPYPSLISAHLRFPSAFPPLMPQVLPLVVQALPMLAQRATYIRSFMWGMPERSQQLGVMIALGVDPVNWYRLKRLIPDMIPRGEAGWRRI